MTAAWLIHRMSDAIFLIVLPLSILHYIKDKTFWQWWTVMAVFDAVAYGIEGRWGRCVFNWIFAMVCYWFWKHVSDDDDRPKKKRQALRSKFDKILPKPVDTPVYNPTG